EYANVVVYAVKEICDEREVPCPTLLSESGRALTAHHSMLVIPVLGVHRPDSPPINDLPPDSPPVVIRMETAYEEACATEVTGILLESYHDAQDARQEAEQMARLGYLTLDQMAHTESMYWSTCREVLRKLTAAELIPPPNEQLE